MSFLKRELGLFARWIRVPEKFLGHSFRHLVELGGVEGDNYGVLHSIRDSFFINPGRPHIYNNQKSHTRG